MNVEPNMSNAALQAKVRSALVSKGFDVRPHAGRAAFSYALRVARVQPEDEERVWQIVKAIDPGAGPVFPKSSFVHD